MTTNRAMRYGMTVGVLLLLAGCTREAEVPPRGPATPLDPATTGSVSGAVLFRGAAPAPTTLRMSGDAACSGADATEAADVQVSDGKLANVFVYVRDGLGDRVFELPTDAVVIDQKGCVYRPHVLGVQTGQELRFLNSDPTLHNVHTTPEKSSGVNFGMGVKGAKRSIRMAKPETMVTVKCDVHPWMRAYVGVLDHPYFTVTGKDGRFHLGNVPPGDYVIEAWHERFGRRTAKVSLGEKDEIEVEFEFDAG